jgi:DMSO/TMAO reductase YedYZ molybdopterin-dependent catalytic subunit
MQRSLSLPFAADQLTSIDRRQWLAWAAYSGLAMALLPGCRRPQIEDNSDHTPRPLRFPGKVAMRVLNDRPPCLETPWEYYRHDFTPNEAFYVRWHLQFIPTSVDLRTWRLKIGGHVDRNLEMSLDDLRGMEPASVVAVNQCSGNSRGLFEPHMPGTQWGNGALGNARWTGVPLRDLLQRAGLKAGSLDIAFAGMDSAGYNTVPDFTKSLAVDRALTPEILIAYEMNGAPLPMLNGFPVRLVVPGWYATYWVKALTEVNVLPQRYDGYWMSKAYRIPTTANAVEAPDKLAQQTVPINRMNVRSFFVSPEPNSVLRLRQVCAVEGIAFDGGDGITQVDISRDEGGTWQEATLGDDLGPYSFRRWRFNWRPESSGPSRLMVRAVNRQGETQPMTAGWNRSGYMRNVVETLPVNVI